MRNPEYFEMRKKYFRNMRSNSDETNPKQSEIAMRNSDILSAALSFAGLACVTYTVVFVWFIWLS
jgi:hypothetical protein